ncbi:recombinase family protein [Tsuneonella sp. YG55]|uniref:Recombinase family protein n=1 Tax=Tsuneonella litorea TaxID=2976475 RepID=A0A9X3A7H9_9SPHN|nr:recombinase family protein [Tsuneonella litorea]MCT2558421.1 recombinase family protein [Tsuneonella litorea]
MCRVVAYYRVSTEEQGRSGLGLEAQRQAVSALCQQRGWDIVAEFTEVESGKRDDRPQLAAAMKRAKVTGARLVIAKLDRLSRNVAFLAALQDSGTKFTAADMPEADEFTIHILAAVAQRERKLASDRTKAALAAAKARGVKLGNPNGAAAIRRAAKGTTAAIDAVRANAASRAADYAETITDVRASGATSLAAIAKELNTRGIVTARGGSWHPSSVRNLLRRLGG